MQKLLSSCQKSQTVRSRLPWLQHTSTVSVKEFFPISALEDLHDVSREEISVSVETLLEAYKQLWSGGRVRERERDNGETAELRKEIEKLLLKISQTENKLDEVSLYIIIYCKPVLVNLIGGFMFYNRHIRLINTGQ